MTAELPNRPNPSALKGAGETRILATQGVLYWERAWPAILPIFGIAAILIIFSLFDIWRLTPGWLHAGVLALAALAAGFSLWKDRAAFLVPSRRAAQTRLEEDSLLAHAPLQSLDDAPSDPNMADNPLWRAHLATSAERARAARLSRPRETVTARDPIGVRFILSGLLAIALIAGGDDWRTRMAGLFTPSSSGGSVMLADLWIEPPQYTGRAPVYLLQAGDNKSGLRDQINAPHGSRVIAQINGRGRKTLSYVGDDSRNRAQFEKDGKAARGEIALTQSGLLELKLGSQTARWPIGIVPDASPLVAYGNEPTANDQGQLELSYIAQDDYAIATARLEMRLDPDQERPLDAPPLDAEVLSEIRIVDLEGAAGISGERALALDLQADPWAGLTVLAKVVVTDGAGQSGETEEVAASLPTRTFFNPLARTVVEQRQTLAVAAENWRRAGRSLDAITTAPEFFFDRSTDYLLLRTAFWRVMRQDGEGFDDAVEKFWPLALQLEDEALELARQRLEAAQEALREAIERGASDEEITRLTEELRQAMNNYLAALAASGQRQAQQGGGGQSQQIDQSNLDEMLNSIRDLAQSGAGNAARQMLSDLENILNNLRLSQSSGQGGSGQGQGSPSNSGPSGKAGDIIGQQRELADEAFERGQNGSGEAGENGDDLAEREEGLGGELDELIEELQGGGADPNGEAARSLGQARNNMREAEQALRNGDFDTAASAMERAIGNIREGAEGLAREEMREAKEGQENGRGAGTDPLGRPVGEAYGQGVDVPGESEAARSRAIIEDLRERLGEPGREEDEIDYLERLLERF